LRGRGSGKVFPAQLHAVPGSGKAENLLAGLRLPDACTAAMVPRFLPYSSRFRMLRRLYDRTLALAAHKHAPLWLALISFAESSFFPVPPDVLLLPMCLARRDQAWRFATICTAASVLGGIVGYGIGLFLFDVLARPIIDAYGYAQGFANFQRLYDEWGLWVILIKGLTPIPYKVVTIASGVAQFDFVVFVLASILTRGVRFFLVAGLVWKFGAPVQAFIEKRLTLVTSAVAAAAVAGVVVLRYI